MKKYQHLIDGKSNEELLNILKEYQKYEPKYIEEIKEELRNRNQAIDFLYQEELKEEKETGKPTFKMPKEQQAYLKTYTDIRGWLSFFLGIMTLGVIFSTIFGITSFNYEEYGGSIFLLLGDITIFVEGLIMVGYIIYAFTQREANAVFWSRVYLLYLISNNFLFLLLGEEMTNNEGRALIRSIIWSTIWLIFLAKSKNVKEVIPQDYRKVTTLDWTFVIVLTFLPILFFIIGLIQLT